MISPHLRFEGFDSRSFTNLVGLFAPTVVTRLETEIEPSDAPDAPEDPSHALGALVIVLDDRDRVLKAFHSRRGRITGLTWSGPEELEALAARFGARRVIALREGVMEEIGERVGRRLERGDDYIAQCLTIGRTIREMVESGLVMLWPRPMANVPIPTAGMVRRALDTVLPDERALVAVVWRGNATYTAIVLRRRGGLIDLIAGPESIARWTGPLGGDWRRDYRVVSDAIARSVAPVHLGIFTEVETLRSLLRTSDPGVWASAVAVRDVIVHPTPPYVAVALGADAVRAVARTSARFLGGLDAFGPLTPVARYVRGRVQEVASVSSTLGMNPLELLAGWLRRAEDAALEERAEAEEA